MFDLYLLLLCRLGFSKMNSIICCPATRDYATVDMRRHMSLSCSVFPQLRAIGLSLSVIYNYFQMNTFVLLNLQNLFYFSNLAHSTLPWWCSTMMSATPTNRVCFSNWVRSTQAWLGRAFFLTREPTLRFNRGVAFTPFCKQNQTSSDKVFSFDVFSYLGDWATIVFFFLVFCKSQQRTRG